MLGLSLPFDRPCLFRVYERVTDIALHRFAHLLRALSGKFYRGARPPGLVKIATSHLLIIDTFSRSTLFTLLSV